MGDALDRIVAAAAGPEDDPVLALTRRVSSPEGAKRYGKPIGSPIEGGRPGGALASGLGRGPQAAARARQASAGASLPTGADGPARGPQALARARAAAEYEQRGGRGVPLREQVARRAREQVARGDSGPAPTGAQKAAAKGLGSGPAPVKNPENLKRATAAARTANARKKAGIKAAVPEQRREPSPAQASLLGHIADGEGSSSNGRYDSDLRTTSDPEVLEADVNGSKATLRFINDGEDVEVKHGGKSYVVPPHHANSMLADLAAKKK